MTTFLPRSSTWHSGGEASLFRCSGDALAEAEACRRSSWNRATLACDGGGRRPAADFRARSSASSSSVVAPSCTQHRPPRDSLGPAAASRTALLDCCCAHDVAGGDCARLVPFPLPPAVLFRTPAVATVFEARMAFVEMRSSLLRALPHCVYALLQLCQRCRCVCYSKGCDTSRGRQEHVTQARFVADLSRMLADCAECFGSSPRAKPLYGPSTTVAQQQRKSRNCRICARGGLLTGLWSPGMTLSI